MTETTFAFFDEDAKKEIRRALLKAVALPGYIVPFASREMPVARGWGTGGLQITLSIILETDTLKVYDQGCDGSVNAVNIRDFIVATTNVETTTHAPDASIIQTRHRIPEHPLCDDQILVLQVPYPEILTTVEPDTKQQKNMHAHLEYSRLWMLLFGAGREKRIYAIPPHTRVKPLVFEDRPFKVENFGDTRCERCGISGVFFDEVHLEDGVHYFCSDTDFCDEQLSKK